MIRSPVPDNGRSPAHRAVPVSGGVPSTCHGIQPTASGTSGTRTGPGDPAGSLLVHMLHPAGVPG